jgi:hypothetical protein
LSRITTKDKARQLPVWPQKANKLRRVQALRIRLRKELELLNDLASEHRVPTDGRAAFQVLDDLEWVIGELPSSSPHWVE